MEGVVCWGYLTSHRRSNAFLARCACFPASLPFPKTTSMRPCQPLSVASLLREMRPCSSRLPAPRRFTRLFGSYMSSTNLRCWYARVGTTETPCVAIVAWQSNLSSPQ